MGTRKNTLVTLLAALALGCASTSDTPDDNAGDGMTGEDPDEEFEIGEDDLIDNFEDEDDGIETLDGRTGSWYTFNDESAGAVQTPEGEAFKPSGPGANGSKFAAVTTGKGFKEWGAGLGVDLNYDGSFEASKTKPKDVWDASKHEGITFLAKGNAAFRFSVVTRKVLLDENGGTCVAGTGDPGLCDNGHGVSLTATAEWKRFKVPFSSIKQDEGWGQVIAFDPKEVVGLQFQVEPNITFELAIDDVAFY